MQLLQLQKRTMALAGTVMTAYLLFHMLSNLSFFCADAFTQFYDVYNQAWIRWPVLFLVAASLLIHVKAAVAIRAKNAKARQLGYQKYDYFHIPAPLVTLSISLLLLFIVVHIGQALLLDTTQLRAELVNWFSSFWLLLFYVGGVFILAMHLQHSLVNVLQTLGVRSTMYKTLVNTSVLLLAVGFVSVPVYIFWSMA